MYNPEYRKAVFTLASVILQTGVSFELVLADDGSDVDITDDLKRQLVSWGCSQDAIKISRSESNRGTVANIHKALRLVEAPIVKLISPGDALYDSSTLALYVDRFERECADVVFGKGVYLMKGSPNRVVDKADPLFPRRYETTRFGHDLARKNLIFDRDMVLGASMAFGTTIFRQCIDILCGRVRYVEDNTSLALILERGGTVSFLDEYVVWYEYGTGISTSGDDGWSQKLAQDSAELWQILMELYPGDKYVRLRQRKGKWIEKSGGVTLGRRILWKVFHPVEIAAWLRKRTATARYRCQGVRLEGYERIMDFVQNASPAESGGNCK